jgi:hypothetical protein
VVVIQVKDMFGNRAGTPTADGRTAASINRALAGFAEARVVEASHPAAVPEVRSGVATLVARLPDRIVSLDAGSRPTETADG